MKLNKAFESFKKSFRKIVKNSKKVYSERIGVFVLAGLYEHLAWRAIKHSN